jgi:hypothetical protein
MKEYLLTSDINDRYSHSKIFPNKDSPNKVIYTTNYRVIEEGRWRPVHIHFPRLFLGENGDNINSKVNGIADAFDVSTQIFTLAWMGDEPGTKYSWDSTWDLNEEEVYWIGPNMIRKDEQGRPMHSFQVEIIFYKDGK